MKNINRNLAIGSIIVAAGIGAIIYPKLRHSKKNYIKENNNENGTNRIQEEKEDIKIVKSANDVLLNKIGVSKSEVEQAKIQNKTAYDIAIDKGFSKEQLRMFVNQDRTRNIDELELNRKISNSTAERAKEKVIEDTNNWNGMLC